MTVVAFLSVAPVTEESMGAEVAKAVDALEAFDVRYETTPMGTTIEADEIGEVFAAARAAHEAVDGDRVSTRRRRGVESRVRRGGAGSGRPERAAGRPIGTENPFTR